MESSIFCDYRCHISGGAASCLVSSFCSVCPVLAVGTSNNEIVFFLEEGISDQEAVVNLDSTPVALCWKPKSKQLVCGMVSDPPILSSAYILLARTILVIDC